MKTWEKGRHCVLTDTVNNVPAGTKGWVYSVSADEIVVLRKDNLEEVSFRLAQANQYINLRPGKPRKDFDKDKLSNSNVKTVNPEIKSILDAARA